MARTPTEAAAHLWQMKRVLAAAICRDIEGRSSIITSRESGLDRTALARLNLAETEPRTLDRFSLERLLLAVVRLGHDIELRITPERN